MISLSDTQLKTVMATAASIDPERRDVFLRRIGAMLKLRGRFNDADVDGAVKLARRVGAAAAGGLTHCN